INVLLIIASCIALYPHWLMIEHAEGNLSLIAEHMNCRTQRGDLATDAQTILNLWREQFSNLLNSMENGESGDG
ncbi:unnamed protein product, partial [Ceratitis capitata]